MKLLNVPKNDLGIFWRKSSILACFLQPVSCHMSFLCFGSAFAVNVTVSLFPNFKFSDKKTVCLFLSHRERTEGTYERAFTNWKRKRPATVGTKTFRAPSSAAKKGQGSRQ